MSDTRKVPQLVKDAVRRLYEARETARSAEKYYEEVKKKESLIVSNWMFSELPRGEKTFDIYMDEGERFYTNHTNLKVSRQRRTKINWDIERLKKSLPKSVYDKAVNRTYTVNDMDGLIKYLKSCGVSPKIFKSYIDVEHKPDVDRLNQLYMLGEVNRSDIEGCYTVEQGELYIKIVESKKT